MTDYKNLDINIMKSIKQKEQLFNRIKKMIQEEIKNMKIIVEIFSKKYQHTDKKMIYGIFFIPQKEGKYIHLGEIPFPSDPEAKLNELINATYNDVTIRELMLCMAQFTFAHELPDNGEEGKYIPRGTMIMLDVVLNIEYYSEKAKQKNCGLNIDALQKKKEELITFFGYDIETIKIFINKMIKKIMIRNLALDI